MKALITGASSLPGFRITEAMLRKGHQVMALYLTHDIPLNSKNLIKVALDIRNYNDLVKATSEFRPDVIIHAVALGDVDVCEKDKALAWNINVGHKGHGQNSRAFVMLFDLSIYGLRFRWAKRWVC